jgi:BlaI family transcriptional regulator, penicillinase repressor
MSKEEYTKTFLKSFVKKYFGNSFQKMVSFFAQEEDLSIHEMEELKKLMDDEINNQKDE